MNHRFSTILLTGALMLPVSISASFAADAPTTGPAATQPDADLIDTVDLVPVEYRHRLVQQLSVAEDNQQNWLNCIAAAAPAHREALAYLLINMPDQDLKKLKGDFLRKNVELAYEAREQTAWGKAVPKEIFFRDVLPYFNMDEARDDWRQDYFDRFMPLVKDAKTATDAATILNRKVFPIVKVKYSKDKRQKPNQSPYESAGIGFASCTGLSIILSDACRAVGVPARVAGTPLWSDKSGNHTWTEIWDRQWYYTGSAEPAKELNKAWFSGNAAKADDSQPETRIYAVSFEQTPTVFPLVWNLDQSVVKAVNVTSYYTGRRTLSVTLPANASVEIRLEKELVGSSPDTHVFTLAGGQQYTVNAVDRSGKTIESRTVSLKKDADSTVDFTAPAKN